MARFTSRQVEGAQAHLLPEVSVTDHESQARFILNCLIVRVLRTFFAPSDVTTGM